MVTIAGKPLLWHLMKSFSLNGINDFIICLGYKGEVIRDYFLNFSSYNSDFSINTSTGKTQLLGNHTEDWNVTLVETGEFSQTGERLKRVQDYILGDVFIFTYGDGLSNHNVQSTIQFNTSHKTLVTLTAVMPPARYGAVEISDGLVTKFAEKSEVKSAMINGGFFVVNRDIFGFLSKFENPSWEFEILPKLALQNQVSAFQHDGFWYAMDTPRDKEHLENLVQCGQIPWLSHVDAD